MKKRNIGTEREGGREREGDKGSYKMTLQKKERVESNGEGDRERQVEILRNRNI